jgi:hypothetical protein
MTGCIWGGLYILGGLALMALGDLVSEEIRGWLDLAPRGILRLAAARLADVGKTTIYEDEWLPELIYILRGAESRPITRLITGTKYAFGILVSANRISRHLYFIKVRAAPEIWNAISAVMTMPASRFEPAAINAKDWISIGKKFRQGARIALNSSTDGRSNFLLTFEEDGRVLGIVWNEKPENLHQENYFKRIHRTHSGSAPPITMRWKDPSSA